MMLIKKLVNVRTGQCWLMSVNVEEEEETKSNPRLQNMHEKMEVDCLACSTVDKNVRRR